MRLTQWTDYTLRVLMYCAASQERELPVTITEIADSHGISRSHLTKIVQQLGAQGLLETTRGRGGGLRLRKPARDINIGAIVRETESDFTMVECFDPSTNQCGLNPSCKLKGLLQNATASYLAVLDAVTLEELVTPTRSTVTMPSSKKGFALLGIPG
ncbi:MAG TPA: Rrf2 family transcriptional regulator [Rhodoferax sp.]|jgi:Rrf2 family nitric oxide-sensitive transcriptional repressor|nr:Rrf2 family transcriptional regulator [Rhodoferax sp.]HPW84471.1 Rrf2 family transcriptional regulator [Rhodoferax sp.]HQC84541.1 Rrf2 family transcriptional regulator [Rhodoferax sp.]HQY76706.1 Rrf2 family transcriptional regulator [Rhodoferax sp.]